MKYKQGTFTPKNKEKYKGKFPIIYRSSWELKMFYFLDRNPNILSWGSESAIIQYVDTTRNNSIHNYIIDLTCKIKDKNGNINKFYLEIKPYAQCNPPIKGKKKENTYMAEMITYQRNMCKWKAAAEFAKQKGCSFLILTEKNLFH